MMSTFYHTKDEFPPNLGNTDFTPLQNRVLKRFKHLQKWAKRSQVSCFRVYDHDMTEYPYIIDWYDGDILCWQYHTLEDGKAQKARENTLKQALAQAFERTPDNVFLKTRGIQKGLQTQYDKLDTAWVTKTVFEGGLKFEVNLSDYLDTGLFLDHRQTRDYCRSLCKGKRLLNLFAYTGSFTCYGIDGGASATTTVDLNANYSEWTHRNFVLNGFNRVQDEIVTDNCMSFIKLAAGGKRFDVIVCDPPTFSNSKKMKEAFSVDEDYPDLLKSCLKLLNPNGVLLFSTNSRRFKFDTSLFPETVEIKEITHKTVPEDFKSAKSHRCFELRKP